MKDFEVLGLPMGANQEEIKSAFKKLSLVHHPDKGGNPNKFIEIRNAYKRLTVTTCSVKTSKRRLSSCERNAMKGLKKEFGLLDSDSDSEASFE